jgi:thiosulfate/3-mercaptopyruvate sulfurtransferase
MSYTSVISTTELAAHLDDPDWAIMDCRFSLTVTERGRRDYQEVHIPGAVYVHLDNDLCAPIIPGKTGRHPLASIEQLVENFSNWGIGPGVQVVAYDDWPGGSGAIAARLWWSLRYLGHQDVAILDGGWVRWWSENRALRSGIERRTKRIFIPKLRPELIASGDDVDHMRADPSYRVFDSRGLDRYRGENETIDPIAGHIPGAAPAPYADNIGPGGLFLPPEVLKKRFLALLGDIPASRAVFYCGSGVTAAHNLVALALAGLGDARLYVGSWSEWITDPQRPVAR